MHASDDRLISLYTWATDNKPEQLNAIFERHGVEPDKAVHSLVVEIKRDGANTLADWVRSLKKGRFEGVTYEEICRHVAEKFDVDHADAVNELDVERRIINKVIERLLSHQPSREKLAAELEKMGADAKEYLGALLKGGSIAAMALTPVVQRLLAELLTRWLIQTSAARAAGLAIPGLNILLGVWMLADVTGPANRKIVPTVVETALLRHKYIKHVRK